MIKKGNLVLGTDFTLKSMTLILLMEIQYILQ